jgi:hypothetical protein
MGRADRCAVLRNLNRVVSSDRSEGLAAVDDLYGPMGLEFGTMGSGRCSVSELNDGTGQEDPDPITRCLLENAYVAWVKRDRLKRNIIHQIRSLLWDPCYNKTSMTSKRSIVCGICSGNHLILREMYARIFYVMPCGNSRQ